MSLWNVNRVTDLPEQVEIAWAWRNYLPLGTVSMLGGPGGVGKSVLVAALEIAIASGRPFLESEVQQGAVLHLDFDTDARLQGPWYARTAKGMNAPEGVARLIHYAAPTDEGSPFLTRDRLEALGELVTEHRPVLVVIDAWTSAFPYIRGNDAGEVAQVMAVLRELAKSGPAVLILDHTPKPQANGPSSLERGLLGSTLKMAGSRAVHLLSRVQPRDVDGKDVQRLDTVKNNLAAIGEPLGIERVWSDDGAVGFHVTDLPESESRAPALERAARYIRDALEQETPRKELLKSVIRGANVSERTAASALARLITAGQIEKTVQGREVVYRPLAALQGSGKGDEQGQKSVQRDLHTSPDFARVPASHKTPPEIEELYRRFLSGCYADKPLELPGRAVIPNLEAHLETLFVTRPDTEGRAELFDIAAAVGIELGLGLN